MKKTRVEFNSCGPSGNVFHVIGMVQQVMRKQHRIMEFNEMWERVQNSKRYEEALAIMREYVELIDLDKKY